MNKEDFEKVSAVTNNGSYVYTEMSNGIWKTAATSKCVIAAILRIVT